MTSQNLLQQLHHLDKSSSGFHDQLCNILYGEEYKQSVSNLQGGNLVELVDCLDKVRRCGALSHLCLNKSA